MNKKEANDRIAAAQARMKAADVVSGSSTASAHGIATLLAACLRLGIYVTVGFALTSTLQVSAWWGPLCAFVVALTAGSVWAWARRTTRVETAEAVADQAEEAAEVVRRKKAGLR